MNKIFLSLIVLMILLVGCNEANKISTSEFKRQYELGNMQTMKSAEYLGQKDGKAFMKIKTMSSLDSKKWSEEIVYAELNELDDKFKESLPKNK